MALTFLLQYSLTLISSKRFRTLCHQYCQTCLNLSCHVGTTHPQKVLDEIAIKDPQIDSFRCFQLIWRHLMRIKDYCIDGRNTRFCQLPLRGISNSNNATQIRSIFVKFTFSEKATKIDKIFAVNLTICSNRQINGEDFINFCGLLGKYEL